MRSEYLRTLVESIVTGSFAKAADNLCITQSAVSRRIKFLEDECGYPLVDRSGPLLLTEAGKVVYDRAHKMLQLEDELLRDLRGLAPRQGITFCCTPSFGLAYLPEVIKKFMRCNPDMSELKFSCEMPDKVLDGLHKGIYQVGVIEHSVDLDLSDLDTWDLPGDEVVFVSPSPLGLAEKTVPLESLMTHDLYIRKEGCCSSRLLELNMKNLGRENSEFKRVIFCDDLHMILDAVLEGNGVAFISRSVVEKHVHHGRLRTHHVDGFVHTYRRTLILNKPAVSDPLLKNFVNDIRAVFNDKTSAAPTHSAAASSLAKKVIRR